MSLSFRNRIAFHYAISTGALVLIVFLLLYTIMYRTVYNHLDSDLYSESVTVLHSMTVLSNEIVFSNEREWMETEHNQVELNPMFLQVVDAKGGIIRKSSNLREQTLAFNSKLQTAGYDDGTLQHSSVRQLQLPLKNAQGKTLGYLIVAMPTDEAERVLQSLRRVLIIALPIVLLVVFYTSRFLASRSVAPIAQIISTAERISSQNLDERVMLPENKDELFRLIVTINDLLDRLKDALLRERQFTADASHELRTPLAALKGTLEVLIRKPRTNEHYIARIQDCIAEVDRLSDLVDQLLMLARYEATQIAPSLEMLNLQEVVDSALAHIEPIVSEQKVHVMVPNGDRVNVEADRAMLEVMAQNILGNAVKYSPEGASVEVSWQQTAGGTALQVRDHGPGIAPDARTRIFDRFFRADQSRNSNIGGVGLGLAIVKRLADLQNLRLEVRSGEDNNGTIFEIIFPH
jgi:two-component system, OmpR family, heavy metal sensor histidine kinase CusS